MPAFKNLKKGVQNIEEKTRGASQVEDVLVCWHFKEKICTLIEEHIF